MADLTITKQWPTGIRRVETTDPWVGGEDGTANIQAKQIGGALAYLKDFADEVQAARGAETSLSARIEKRGVDAQNILSKFAYIETVPVAASVESIDVVKGGLLVIDGIKTKAGEVVFLKDQSDKKQNGFWEVQTGAWNRAAGYTAADMDCFTYKLITIDAGNTNKGRIYFLDDDSYRIDADNLVFKESAFSYEAQPGKAVIRDRAGTIKDVEKLIEDNGASLSVLVDESQCRNLLDVFGIRAVHSDEPATLEEIKKAMAILHKKINADGSPDFSGLRLGDYLDLPELNDGETTYKWSGEYKNLRIMISAFNVYKNAAYPENEKNHIVFTFRNCVSTRKMNDSDVNAGGYSPSKLASYLDGGFKTGLEAVLGNTLYAVHRLLSTKGNRGWKKHTVFLPTEREVWVTTVYGERTWDGGFQAQYPIFRDSALYKVKRHNGSRMWWWHASPSEANATTFCACDNYGRAGCYDAGGGGGVAPAFCVA